MDLKTRCYSGKGRCRRGFSWAYPGIWWEKQGRGVGASGLAPGWRTLLVGGASHKHGQGELLGCFGRFRSQPAVLRMLSNIVFFFLNQRMESPNECGESLWLCVRGARGLRESETARGLLSIESRQRPPGDDRVSYAGKIWTIIVFFRAFLSPARHSATNSICFQRRIPQVEIYLAE